MLPLLSDVLRMLHLRMTRRLPSLQIAEETDDATDQIHMVWTKIGPVQVRVCLLSCAEEVCFQMLMPSNIESKIRLLGLLSPQNDNNS